MQKFEYQLKQLDLEILLNESFVDLQPEQRLPLPTIDLFSEFQFLRGMLDNPMRLRLFQDLYNRLFQRYPIIKTKLKLSSFESWAITHDIDDLKVLLKAK